MGSKFKAKDTSLATFTKHFRKYGEIINSVIMKDRNIEQPRDFGFITYADPSVKIIEETHVINVKQLEIKRTIPKGSVQSKDFKRKKIFVGGVSTIVAKDKFKMFSKHGKVVDHQIIRDHAINHSRGFGFIIFDNEQVVDDMLAKGRMNKRKAEPFKLKVEIKLVFPCMKVVGHFKPPRSYGSFHDVIIK
uniref:RRM domain-containing protein n=1 Tax=Nelumbo nucifera TaxID=4432 RepID=A0A822Y4S9_NELNU|nr:TPA_asm: hypothetical protein HUJ06_030412 [Nelumbo nucifera]